MMDAWLIMYRNQSLHVSLAFESEEAARWYMARTMLQPELDSGWYTVIRLPRYSLEVTQSIWPEA